MLLRLLGRRNPPLGLEFVGADFGRRCLPCGRVIGLCAGGVHGAKGLWGLLRAESLLGGEKLLPTFTLVVASGVSFFLCLANAKQCWWKGAKAGE